MRKLNSMSPIFSFLLLLFIFSCSSDLDISNNVSDTSPLLEQLKQNFNQSGKEITEIHFENQQSKGLSSNQKLSVKWNEATQFQQDGTIILDIPLHSPNNQCLINTIVNHNIIKEENLSYNSRLIYKKNSKDSSFMFVVTMINKDGLNEKKFNQLFFQNRDFSGLMLISDIDGNYLASHNVKDGVQSDVYLLNEETPLDSLGSDYQTFQLSTMSSPRAYADNPYAYFCRGAASFIRESIRVIVWDARSI